MTNTSNNNRDDTTADLQRRRLAWERAERRLRWWAVALLALAVGVWVWSWWGVNAGGAR